MDTVAVTGGSHQQAGHQVQDKYRRRRKLEQAAKDSVFSGQPLSVALPLLESCYKRKWTLFHIETAVGWSLCDGKFLTSACD